MRKRHAEPQPLGDLTDAPDWFAPGEREQWEYAIRHSPPGMVKLLDRDMLITWCEASHRHHMAMVALAELNRRNRNPPYLVMKQGNLVISPLVAVLDKAAMVMLRCAQELGFSPAARPRLKADMPDGQHDEQPDDPWATLRVIPGGKAG